MRSAECGRRSIKNLILLLIAPGTYRGGLYQADPKLKDPGTPGMKITSCDKRSKDIGADAYKAKIKRKINPGKNNG